MLGKQKCSLGEMLMKLIFKINNISHPFFYIIDLSVNANNRQ